MSTDAAASTVGGPTKFILKPKETTKAAIQDHGAQLVSTQTIYNLRLRFRYFVHYRNCDMINIVQWHKTTIQTLLKVDPQLVIVPNDPLVKPYSDVRSFPTDKGSFEQQFAETSELVGNKAQRITVCHAVRSTMTLWNMKWKRDVLMPYLMKNHITIMVDKFDQAVVSSIGYFIRVNPHYIHRELFQEEIFKVIEENVNFQDQVFRAYTTIDDEDMENEFDTLDIPAFELGLTPIKFGNGSFQSASEAVNIFGTKETAPFLKEIFSSIDYAKHMKGCMFLPRGLIQMTSVDTFQKYISLQNQYLSSVDCIPILGIFIESARYPIVVQTEGGDITSTIIGALEMFPGIQSVYQTNATPTIGKWLVTHLKSEEVQVKKFLDEVLERLFICIPEGSINRCIGEYGYPRRPGLQRRNGHTLSYATLLQK
jgi:hypothetical protein